MREIKLPLDRIQVEFFKALRAEASVLPSLIDPIASLNVNECIEIYKRGYEARLTEALGETFEASWWVLGDEDFFRLSRKFISQNISKSHDLSDYGGEFPEFLKRDGISDEIPFISDLARFEWVFKTIFHKRNMPDHAMDWHAFSAVGEPCFTLSPSAMLFTSPFSVYEIWRRRDQNIQVLESVDWSRGERLIVFKRDSQVYVKCMDENTFALAEGLSIGLGLEESIQRRLEEVGSMLTPEVVQQSFALIAQLGVFLFSESGSREEQHK